MGDTTKIEWCDHTFNPWRGCARVSPGCRNCYAETFAKRNPDVLGEWGAAGTRVVASELMWQSPVRWNRAAERAGVRRRVFSASLADVFEPRADLAEPRGRLIRLIEDTPWLDWLLLTKRPEQAAGMLHRWLTSTIGPDCGRYRWSGPSNVWLGVSVEDQARADERIPYLADIPAPVRFLSCEPLLDRVELGQHVDTVDWVIIGGESGPGHRWMKYGWAGDLAAECVAADVPVFFKQMSGHRQGARGPDFLERHKQFPMSPGHVP